MILFWLLLQAKGCWVKKTQTPLVKIGDKRLIKFRKALDDVMKDLAIQIVKDGEGLLN